MQNITRIVFYAFLTSCVFLCYACDYHLKRKNRDYNHCIKTDIYHVEYIDYKKLKLIEENERRLDSLDSNYDETE